MCSRDYLCTMPYQKQQHNHGQNPTYTAPLVCSIVSTAHMNMGRLEYGSTAHMNMANISEIRLTRQPCIACPADGSWQKSRVSYIRDSLINHVSRILADLSTALTTHLSCQSQYMSLTNIGCDNWGEFDNSDELSGRCQSSTICISLTYSTLQHTAAHCNTLQHRAVQYAYLSHISHCNTLQRTATQSSTICISLTYITLQHTATHCNTEQYDMHISHILADIEQYDMQYDMQIYVRAVRYADICESSTIRRYMWEQYDMQIWSSAICIRASRYASLSHMQHTATHCNTLQHTAVRYASLSHISANIRERHVLDLTTQVSCQSRMYICQYTWETCISDNSPELSEQHVTSHINQQVVSQ